MQSANSVLHELRVHQIELEMQNENLREVQAALQKSHDRYVDLYKFLPIGYLTLTDAGVVAEANPTAATLLGVERSRLVDSLFDRHISSAGLQRWINHRTMAMRTEGKHTLSLEIKRGNGESLVGRIDCLRKVAADGSLKLHVAITDISVQQRFQDELRRSQLFNKSILDSVPIEIAVLDRNGIIREVNAAWQQFAQDNRAGGLAGAEKLGIGANYLEVCRSAVGETAAGAPEALAGVVAVLSGRLSSFRLEYPCHCTDQQRWFSMNVSPMEKGGEGVVVTHADITDRKQAEAELQVNEERLRMAQTVGGLGIFDHSIAKGIYKWDERMRELWGYGPDRELTRADFVAGIHPSDRAATQAAIDRAFDSRGSGRCETEFRVVNQTDGSIRYVAGSGWVSFHEGSPVRFVGTIKEITAQKLLEKQMQERRSEMQLLVSQQVAAHTAAAIAHELNQPLVAVSAYSEAALRMLSSQPINKESSSGHLTVR